MREILRIFKRDIAKILKSKMAIVILAGMTIIPGIYAWLNIDSNWDPYDNTGNIKIAVVNKDKGVSLFKDNVNIGDSLVDKLETNDAMDWTFVDDETEAKDKVECGEYYGAIFLPEDFSNKITTLFDGPKIVKPEFDFYINDKKNPIAPIIINKAVGTLESTLDQAFVNAIVYKVVDGMRRLDIADKGVATINGVISKLDNIKGGVGKLKTTVNVISSATESTADALSAVRTLLPTTLNNFANNATTGMNNLKNAVGSFSNVNDRVDRNINAIFESMDELSKATNKTLTSLNAGDAKLKEKLGEASKILDSLASILAHQEQIIASLQDVVDTDALAALQGKIAEALQKANELKAILQYSSETGTMLLEQAKAKVSELGGRVADSASYYRSTLAPAIKSALERSTTTLNNFASTFNFLNGSFTKSDAALSNTVNALKSVTGMNADIEILLSNLESDIDRVEETLGKVGESELYLKIVNLLQNMPDDVADFISKPIQTNKVELYKIDHYGSKMAPFYTILATWVGCTLLVAVLKTNIEEDEDNTGVKPYQAFFGRFLLFGTIAMLQGLVIGLGDVILHVQILNLPLFLLTIMSSSLVYMLIIYSLTISFGKIGEALAVVMLVMQVAGSGGTFPIELLPDFFQKMQPFMPFYPSMNAVRETIGGFYQNNYLIYMAILLCHTIVPLLLGLVIRRPIIELKNRISKDVEETEVIV